MKRWHWILIVFSILVIISIILFKSNIPKTFLNKLNEGLRTEVEISKRKYDSIKKVRKKDSINFIESIKNKTLEIEGIKKQLEIQRQKAYRYEKELSDYRRGNFDERFKRFSDLVRENDLPK